MKSYKIFFGYFIALFCLCYTCLSQVIETPKGKYEFIGLTSWKPQKLIDTLYAIDHPCAAILRSKLGFADASVVVYMDGERPYTVITVLEHQFADHVHYKSKFIDTNKIIESWKDIIQIFEKHPMEYQFGIANFGFVLLKQNDTAISHLPDWIDINVVKQFWNILQNHNKIEDQQLAIRIINEDGNYENRIAAATMLANFFVNDSTWWILVDALRDPDGRVSQTAQQALSTISKTFPRQVNWCPMVNSIKYLIDGTNLFAFSTIADVLIKTKVSSSLARPLLKDGTDILLDFLKAHHLNEKEIAWKLLVLLGGKDFGFDDKKWVNWISSL